MVKDVKAGPIVGVTQSSGVEGLGEEGMRRRLCGRLARFGGD